MLQNIRRKASHNSGQAEMKIILSSTTDTLVKACTDTVISTVQRDEEGKWEIVFIIRTIGFGYHA